MTSIFWAGLVIFGLSLSFFLYGIWRSGYQCGWEAHERANKSLPLPRFIVREDCGYGGQW